MINFDDGYFQRINFKDDQITQFFLSAKRDLEIARRSDVDEVIFKFAYDALIKLGIALIAKYGYKVRSKTGHHVKIIDKLSQISGNEDIEIIANRMRQSRNLDLYDGNLTITHKDAVEYLEFVEELFNKTNI